MQPLNESVSSAWDQYWQGDKTGHAYADLGISQPALQDFWTRRLNTVLSESQAISMIDLACGNGALTELAHSIKGSCSLTQTCLDVSTSALHNIKQRLPHVITVCSNMDPIDLDSSSFDLVVSQFGIEYAGTNAFNEAMRLVAPGGYAIFVMHRQSSVIEHESRTNYDAITQMLATGLLEQTGTLLKAGYQVMRSNEDSDKIEFKRKAVSFNAAVRGVEDILEFYGIDVTAGTIHRLYNDVAQIVENMPKYHEAEVLEWLHRMQSELTTYQTRMASMLKAALSNEQQAKLKTDFTDAGFHITIADDLFDTQGGQMLGWVFCAQKST